MNIWVLGLWTIPWSGGLKNKQNHFPQKPAFLIVCLLVLCLVRAPYSCGEYGFSPQIDYLKLAPKVQLPNMEIVCICIIFPAPEDISVVLYLLTPLNVVAPIILEFDESGKFTTVLQLKDIGRYTYWVEAKYESNTILLSEQEHFWIAFSLEDHDSDLIRDTWEIQYGLDPEDPSDAALDYDSDGFTNRGEYEMGTNPKEDNLFENNLYRLRSHSPILLLSFCVFISLFILSLFGLGRSRAWS